MTPKEQLVHELETIPEPLITELLVFLRLAKMRHHSQTEQPFCQFIEELVADIPPNVLDTLPSEGMGTKSQHSISRRTKVDDHNRI